ncbi:undecaprenyl-diphospho-oligosaccharide flippase [Syntrophotalea carbinolica DSM 2380]|uniref:Undecaprenyl-diphospho-oligosaccharide flippase n=1 Tax=Syntrophotalea carbinolica (strain DSM 2380 / NBRC 103641 / GraBd1) TaxID=338963 RepID=Q3A4D6_SYNC1|nr:oligosaccharide flippase family protein [Syntrophotalea carbinolica]ABA88771.1 undecaprenyl-diphospho-oligosaccharide flippase [Syntrophotalea carbinolica DSM 2380]
MLLRHTAAYAVCRGLPGALNFVAIAAYTRLLSPDNYGRYALVIAGVGLFNVIFFQWLRLSLLRFLPSHQGHPKGFLSAILAGFSLLMLTTGVIGILLVFLWPDPTWRGLIGVAVPLLWAQAWFELNLELVRSKLNPARYGLLSGTRASLALCLGVLFLLWGLGVYGPLLGILIGLFVAGVWVPRQEWREVLPRNTDGLIKELLRYGLPLTAAFALSFVVGSSDRFLIAWLIDDKATGVYAAGYDITRHPLITLMMFVNLAAYPLAVRAFEQHGVEAARGQLRQNAVLLFSVALPASVGAVMLAPNIGGLFLGEAFRSRAIPLIPWVAVASLMAGIRAYYFDLAFQLGRHTLVQVFVIGFAALLNVILNVLFIPAFGIVGAAYATVLAYASSMILSAIAGRKYFPLPLPVLEMCKISMACLCMALLLWPVRGVTGLAGFFAQIVMSAVVYASMMVILNVAHAREKLMLFWKERARL